MKVLKVLLLACVFSVTSACVSTVVGEVVDVSVEVVKIPFKVAGAAIDVVSGDED